MQAMQVTLARLVEGDIHARALEPYPPMVVASEKTESQRSRRVVALQAKPGQFFELHDDGPVFVNLEQRPMFERCIAGQRNGALGASVGRHAQPFAGEIC